MSETTPFYSSENMAAELRQGELLSNVIQHIFDPSGPDGLPGTHAKTFPFLIVMSQDCDLLRDFDDREKNKPPALNGVLLYEVELAEAGRSSREIDTRLWRPIKSNNSERYHVLNAVSAETDLAGQGIPALLIDFRRYLTISSKEIERQISLVNGAKRRCRLIPPYREHLQTRAAFYFQRVTLPEPHEV